jgi:uncharacterized short protein YbdD (DUF466 family)
VRAVAQALLGSAAVRGARLAWAWLREVSGDDAYERYRCHHAACHPGEPVLERRAHYEQAQRHKWSGVSRCC